LNKKQSFEIIQKVLSDESEALSKLKDRIDIDSIMKVVEMVDVCRKNNGKVITIGAGNSSIIARKIAHNFSCIEIPSFFLTSEEGLHGGLGVIKENDLVIAFSKGGKTQELLETIPVVKHKKVKLISVTESKNTEFAKAADQVLIIKTDREADVLDMIATSSSACMIAIFDAIMVLMMQQGGFKAEQFAVIHPGGAVGEMLKSKIKH
jgi:KpsF/GutQ family protein